MEDLVHERIQQLLDTCPNTFDLSSLEPFKSLAFLDPLIDGDLNDLVPLSFPDFDLPLAKFDVQILRNLESGEIVNYNDDTELSYTAPKKLFGFEEDENVETEAIRSTHAVLSAVKEKRLPKDFDENKFTSSLLNASARDDSILTCVLDEYLFLASSEQLSKYHSLRKHKHITPAPEPKEVDPGIDETLSLIHLDSSTAEILERRMRKPVDEVAFYAVEEITNEKLPPLNELVADPAFTWPFELDTFQKQAILCLERGQSVLVAAHTSAGKTVVAEYACAMCKRRGSRAIYTSPIKALSNQKFRDFRNTFGEDVGLLTGDIKVATTSSILVMTTEILHNMLCNAAESIRDLEVVIMDEVHYLNDRDRGHVWEQLMIMLPRHVVLVLLSATVPNTIEFADWLGHVRGGIPIHVSATNKRPVPLEHFLYTGTDSQTRENVYLILDKEHKFSLEGYKKAKESHIKPNKLNKKVDAAARAGGSVGKTLNAVTKVEEPRKEKQKPRLEYTGGKANTPGRQNYLQKESHSRSEKSDTTVWVGLIQMLKERALIPVIVFCFSRARITNLVRALDSIDLLSKVEKNEVLNFLRSAIGGRLKGRDQELAQVVLIRKLTMRGIAVHHAGMIPLLKEVVEMLFQRGLVRILFATETFAMGVNMPARCVVFTSIQKHDGQRKRPLTPGEYTQMAGRAGRRGLDSTGTVIIIANNISHGLMPTELQLKQMLLGKPTKLQSQFKITYSMILYLHRGSLQTPLELIRHSFKHASKLRFEMTWRRQLNQLREAVYSTTLHSRAAGSSGLVQSTNKIRPMPIVSDVRPGDPSDSATVSFARVKCPSYPLDSEASSTAVCVEEITKYYLACCRWRELFETFTNLVAVECSLPRLSRVFSAGRLVLLRLSAVSVSGRNTGCATWTLTGSRGAGPEWITAAIVLEVSKVSVDNTNITLGRCPILLKIITWQPPDSPYPDMTMKLGTADEEDLLIEGEPAHLAYTPFPPQLMPLYCPSSLQESQSKLIIVSEVPMTTILGVCSDTCLPANASAQQIANFVDQAVREVIWYRQEQLAAESGLIVHRRGKKGDSDDWNLMNRCKSEDSLASLNRELFSCMSQTLVGCHSVINAKVADPLVRGLLPHLPDRLPVWHQLGLGDISDLEELITLSDGLSWPLDLAETSPMQPLATSRSFAPSSCPDLIGHLALAHRTTRRRWAINRLQSRLSPNLDTLFMDYEARVKILQKLGFLDRDTGSGCLTLKGRAACELQQMEVLLTEFLFDGALTRLPPADIAALLSCFVCESGLRQASGGLTSASVGMDRLQDSFGFLPGTTPIESRVQLLEPPNSDQDDLEPAVDDLFDDEANLPMVPNHLLATVKRMLARAHQLLIMQTEYRVTDPESDTRLSPVLVGATYAWACGLPFCEIVHLTDLAEGHLLRGLQRLDELMRHVACACHRLGDVTLAARISEAHRAVHRDIVCAPSLYLAEETANPLSLPVAVSTD